MATYYVDYSATNDGTGATAAQAATPGGAGAYNTLVGKTFATGDVVWLRRVTTSGQSAITISTLGVWYIGWPKVSTDEFYSSRPASGTSNGWDSDSNTELILAGNTFTLSVTGDNNRLYRIQAKAVTATANVLNNTGKSNSFYSCYFLQVAAATVNCFTSSGSGSRFFGCTFETSASYTASASGLANFSGPMSQYVGCTMKIAGFNTSTSGGGVAFSSSNSKQPIYIQDLTVQVTAASISSSSVALISISCTAIVNNVTITNSVATNVYRILTISGNKCRVRNLSLDTYASGASSTVTNSWLEISGDDNLLYATGFTEERNTGTSLSHLRFVGNGNVVYLRNFTQKNSSTSPTFMVAFASTNLYNNHVYFDGCVTLSDFYNNRPAAPSNWFIVSNYGGVSGLWKAFGADGVAEASNTVRTGGEAYSIRFEQSNNVPGNEDPLQFGYVDGQTMWVTLTAGTRTITLYGAHKNFGTTPPNKNDLWIETETKELDYYNAFKSSRSVGGEALETDSSVWSNDPSVTAFKITLTFTVAYNCVVPLRVCYHKFVAGAYVYIDPLPVVS